MLRTRVGYAGGATENPTYRRIGDHSESVQVLYDPSLVSYEQLLELFWTGHDPTQRTDSRQYASIIFYYTDEQRRLAEQSKADQEQRHGRPVQTEIVAAGLFTQAEGYHQKYYLQNTVRLMEVLSGMLPTEQALVRSTLAARLNAVAGGYESYEELERELPVFGLGSEQEGLLRDVIRRSRD